jgi:hypothetical protein
LAEEVPGLATCQTAEVKRGGIVVNPTGVIALFEGVLGILMAGTWWWVLRHQDVFAGWRRKVSVVALALPTVALVIELGLAVVAVFLTLEELDTASLHGGWYAAIGWLWLSSLAATGLLPLWGLILAAVGKGRPGVAAALWSSVVLGIFLVNLVLTINSFH